MTEDELSLVLKKVNEQTKDRKNLLSDGRRVYSDSRAVTNLSERFTVRN